MSPFLERLQKSALLGDGAMGTLLFARGAKPGECLEALVVERPALIKAIHEEYARAGADVITTHTFGANRMQLADYGFGDKVRDFNLAAVHLAQEVRVETGHGFLVAGNVGPVGKPVQWQDARERAAAADALREQISVLVEAGVDLLLFETFSDVEELELAIGVAKEVRALPIVASMSYGEDGLTLAGQGVAAVTARLLAAGVDVIGANCSVGPLQMVETLNLMGGSAPQGIFSVTPNAGLPERGADGQLSYPVGAEEFAGYVARFVQLGARLVGGCCGTTPEHVRAMRGILDSSYGPALSEQA